MAEIKLEGEERSEFGKGAARRLRRDGKVPAVLYTKGNEPVHLSLPAHATQMALRQANALLSITIGKDKPTLALPKQVQRDPIKGTIEHVDLVIVRADEKVTVEVPVNLIGDPEPGAIAMLDEMSLSVLALATNIPRGIDIDITMLPAGTQILLGDVKMPEGAEAAGDADLLVVNITAAPTEAELEADLAGEGEEGEVAATEEAAEEEADTE